MQPLKGSGVIYNSGVIIADDCELATLTVFYDHVYLPNVAKTAQTETRWWEHRRQFPFGVRPPTSDASDFEWKIYIEKIREQMGPGQYDHLLSLDQQKEVHKRVLRDSGLCSDVRDENKLAWDDNWKELFEEGVLQRCFPPTDGTTSRNKPTAQSAAPQPKSIRQFQPKSHLLGDSPLVTLSAMAGQYSGADEEEDLDIHIRRTDLWLPRLFRVDSNVNRGTIVGLEAFATFRYLLPKLRSLQPDDILELRRRVNDTREGFTMHLQKLSSKLNDAMKNSDKLAEINRYAQDVIETELIPDYREFRRQFQSLRAGRLQNVLDAGGKIAEIDAAPWTPKFWALLLKALGMAAGKSAAEWKEKFSNSHQAFNFMREVEDFGQSKSATW